MGKQKERKRLLVQKPTYSAREAFLLCETEGCRNVVAAWAVPDGYSGTVNCTSCAPLKESK